MTRVAIYARYSSDKQRDASIEDQVRLCRERAEKEGWSITKVYTDHAISGDTLIRRPDMQALFQDGVNGKFDLILSEALDRLSRDQEEIAGVYKRMCFCNVGMFTLAEGEINELHIGLKGTMNALFLKDLGDKVHRGLRGRVENGKSAGGLAYGYDVVLKFDENGERKRGDRTINEIEALTVKRIFREYLEGKSPKAIANQLNLEGIAGPSGKGWGPSTIYGNWRRGNGILNNELYIGQLVWNKVHYIKNPDTGRPVTRVNPQEEWIRKDVPELRIIDQEIWDAVKQRQLKTRTEKPRFWQHQRPRKLLSYLLKCGCCGGGMSKVSTTQYGCSSARNKGDAVCTNRRTIHQDHLEMTVLSILQHNLMNPKLVNEFCKAYTKHINRLRMEHNSSIHSARAEMDKLIRQEERIVEAVKNGLYSDMLKEDMDRINIRKAELNAVMADEKETKPLLHPSMSIRYQQEVNNLIEALNHEEHRHEAAQLIRSMIDKIVLTPDEEADCLVIDLHGDLAGILNMASGADKKDKVTEQEIKQIRLITGLSKGKTKAQDKMVGVKRDRLNLHEFNILQDKIGSSPRNQITL